MVGKPITLQDFPPVESLSEKFRLTYDAIFFGQTGELICSIDNKSDTVTFVQFYVEGGDYSQQWIKDLTPSLGAPYSKAAWKKAINKDILYKNRTPQLIDQLYEQGAREWPLTKEGYKYEVATAKFTRQADPSSPSSDVQLVEATWLRIFDMNVTK